MKENFDKIRNSLKEGMLVYRGVKEHYPKDSEYATDPRDFGRGIYYTNNIHRARAYGDVTKKILVLNNPIVMSMADAYKLAEEYHTVRLPESHERNPEKSMLEIIQDDAHQRMLNAQKMSDDMLNKGYDGLVAVEDDGEIEIVVYTQQRYSYRKLPVKSIKFVERV